MKNLKKNLTLAIPVIAVVGLLIVWAFKAEKNSISKAELYELLEQGVTEIDLTQFANFQWQKADVFGPYTTTGVIEDTMAIDIRFSSIDVMETEFLLVFADGNKMVESVYLSRKFGDYEIKDNRYLITKKSDIAKLVFHQCGKASF
ncbi:hypothetical protein ACTHOQ_05705 [Solibacillus silvestris]|uniref:hypothetical protein n=1 Tax=Solibacillus silvestris TaxID=76853 RepID=UPI003F7FC548